MGLINKVGELLFGVEKRVLITENPLRELYIDVTTKETWSRSVKATTHTIEEGGFLQDITDHVKPKPDKVKMTGVLTNYGPLVWYNPLAYTSILGTDDLARENLDLLEFWKNEGTILSYVGHTGFLDSCIITELGSSEKGDGIAVNIGFQRIVLATALFIEITLPPSISASRAKGAALKGQKKAAEAGGSAAASKSASMLSKLF
jgi:hypothetical protein